MYYLAHRHTEWSQYLLHWRCVQRTGNNQACLTVAKNELAIWWKMPNLISQIQNRYLFIEREHTDMRYWYSNCVPPSVCLSVSDVPVVDENGLTYCHSFFTIPVIQVLSASNIFTKFRRAHPLWGAKYRWGKKNLRFSTNKSLYLTNDKDSAIVTIECE